MTEIFDIPFIWVLDFDGGMSLQSECFELGRNVILEKRSEKCSRALKHCETFREAMGTTEFIGGLGGLVCEQELWDCLAHINRAL